MIVVTIVDKSFRRFMGMTREDLDFVNTMERIVFNILKNFSKFLGTICLEENNPPLRNNSLQASFYRDFAILSEGKRALGKYTRSKEENVTLSQGMADYQMDDDATAGWNDRHEAK